MNPNQILKMALRMIMRRIIGKGMNLGMNAVERKMSKGQPSHEQTKVTENRETMKQVKQSLRVTRKFGKF